MGFAVSTYFRCLVVSCCGTISEPGGGLPLLSFAAFQFQPLAVPELPASGAGIAFRAAPNPSRGSQALTFTLPSRGEVRMDVFDLAGRLVRTLERGTLAAGPHRVTWDGLDAVGAPAPPGIYFVRLGLGSTTTSIKVLRTE
jgi:hypothetical protein